MNIVFRKIEPQDDRALAKIIRNSLEKHSLNIPGTAYFDDNLDHLSSFYMHNSLKREYYVVTDNSGEVLGGIGVAEFPYIDGCAELQKLYLDERIQGGKTGYRLIELAESTAKKMGYKKLYLETHTHLQAAIHIYEKAGFKEIERPEFAFHTTMDRFYIKALL